MKKPLLIAASAVLFLVFSGFDWFGLAKNGGGGETPEHIFNMANEAMIKGNDTAAIDLYYRLIQKHPEFKEYRDDALFRLGTLLFKAERFEEAEKVLRTLTEKYRDYPQIKSAYEKLLYIYVQETRDNAKADRIRKAYEKRFGKTGAIENAEKTKEILNSQADGVSEILSLDPVDLSVIRVDESDSYDSEFFPVKCAIAKKAESPDRRLSVERKKKNGKYFLYINGGKKSGRITGTKNGFGPQWSWDNRFVAFTAMDWGKKERKIKLYDPEKSRIKNLFAAASIGPLICPAPDASMVAFWYLDSLWVVSRNGNSISLITKKVSSKGVFMMAWSREGDKILIGKKVKGRERYYTCRLGRKEFIIVK